MKATKPYFSHDEGARNDPKLLRVMQTLGHEGKSVYWDLVEMLFEQGGYLLLSECETYAFASRTSCALILRLVNDFGLFEQDDTRFWSKTALERLELRNEKAERRAAAGAKGGKARAEKEAIAKALLEQEQSNSQALLEQPLSDTQANKIKESKVKEIEGRKGAQAGSQVLASPSESSKDQPGNGARLYWPDEAPVFLAANFNAFVTSIGYAQIDKPLYLLQVQQRAEKLNEQRTDEGWENFIKAYLNKEVKYDRLILPVPAFERPAKPEARPMPANPQDLWAPPQHRPALPGSPPLPTIR